MLRRWKIEIYKAFYLPRFIVNQRIDLAFLYGLLSAIRKWGDNIIKWGWFSYPYHTILSSFMELKWICSRKAYVFHLNHCPILQSNVQSPKSLHHSCLHQKPAGSDSYYCKRKIQNVFCYCSVHLKNYKIDEEADF